MKPPVPVTAFNLDTLERLDFPSMALAADHCLVDKSMLHKYMRNDQMWRGWYWCPTEVADLRMDRVLYLSRRWQSEDKPKAYSRKEQPKLVPLRIDSHTVILVKPEKATPEYAEEYRQKLLKNSRKY
jgi:hypothetical protein